MNQPVLIPNIQYITKSLPCQDKFRLFLPFLLRIFLEVFV
jgi:hypothetical protein